MEDMKKRISPILIVAALGVLLLGIALWRSAEAPQEITDISEAGQVVSATGTPQSGVVTSSVVKPSGATVPKPQTVANLFVTAPTQESKWVVGVPHEITWSMPVVLTGGIVLLDAQTRAPVGWIHSSLGRSQTSFQWNTKDVALDRSNPLKKDITTGRYIVKIVFDGPTASIESAPFSIIYQNQEPTTSYEIIIQDYKATPSSIAIVKGTRLVVTNHNGTSVKLIMSGRENRELAPGESFIFDTSFYSLGVYTLYSEEYPTISSKIEVK